MGNGKHIVDLQLNHNCLDRIQTRRGKKLERLFLARNKDRAAIVTRSLQATTVRMVRLNSIEPFSTHLPI